MKKVLITLLKIGISAAILGYLVWKAYCDESFSELLRQPKRWGLLTCALAVCGSAVLLTLVRWCYLVRALGLKLPMRDALRIGLLGYLFNLAPMGIVGGDLLKAVMLARRQNGEHAKALASVFVDRAIGLYLLFAVASVAILATDFWKPYEGIRWVCQATLVITAVATVGVIVLLAPGLTNGRLSRGLGRLPYVGPPLLRIVDALRLYRRQPGVLAAASGMSVAVHSLFTLGIFLIALGLYGHQVHSLGRHFVLSPLSAATQVIPIPAGHVEASLHWLYAQMPLPTGAMMTANEGLMVALGYRIITVLIAAVGVCYYLGSRTEIAQVLEEVEKEADAGQVAEATAPQAGLVGST
ncbi:MAG: lysylphosphatidylglycerol synthase transmembrane domain-containing protein [Planctomycetota bacterium]